MQETEIKHLWWVTAETAFGMNMESGGKLYFGAFGRNQPSSPSGYFYILFNLKEI
jgi:hypothetical protein